MQSPIDTAQETPAGSPVFECQMLSVEPQLKWIGIELDLADFSPTGPILESGENLM